MLSSVLLAETQEAAYYRALKAEEAGEISLALESFEEAEKIPGPYTEEIRGIIQEYYKALEMPKEEKNPWSFRFLGDIALYGLRYSESGDVDKVSEHGGDIYASLTPFLDYSTGNRIHSFGLGISGDWFLANDDMPALDTNDWKLTLGLEYTLIGSTILLDVGADLNIAQGEDISPTFYSWVEKDFFRYGKHRLGVAAWGYYDANGPLSFALYGAWHRTSTYGLNAAIYIGPRLDADSIVDYVKYLADYEAAYAEAYEESYKEQKRQPYPEWGKGWQNNPMDACLETYGTQYFEWEIATIDSLYWAKEEESSTADSIAEITVKVPRYYAYWLGPALRSRISYKFKQNITFETKMNLFYSIVLDGPDEDYEKIGKFSMTFGTTVYWKPNALLFYLGIDQLYKHYNLPDYYKGVYPKNTVLSELKAGVKWEI